MGDDPVKPLEGREVSEHLVLAVREHEEAVREHEEAALEDGDTVVKDEYGLEVPREELGDAVPGGLAPEVLVRLAVVLEHFVVLVRPAVELEHFVLAGAEQADPGGGDAAHVQRNLGCAGMERVELRGLVERLGR